jgi:hypothetical protein
MNLNRLPSSAVVVECESSTIPQPHLLTSRSTPLYQILNHALSNPTNKTKFTLLFSNITEADILLKPELDGLKKKFPNNFDVVYILDSPPKDWTGPKGYISKEVIEKHVPAPSSEKVKVFVCGEYWIPMTFLSVYTPSTGPPGQVAALAGKKAGMKQGELGGILKELGYTEDQVGSIFVHHLIGLRLCRFTSFKLNLRNHSDYILLPFCCITSMVNRHHFFETT